MPDQDATLQKICAMMASARDPWWIIAGAATALHLDDWAGVGDIDLLVSEPDARMLIADAGFRDQTDGGNGLYRSAIYATFDLPLPIDLFAAFEINVAGTWTPIHPSTRIAIPTPAGAVFVPAIHEQIAITRLLGRPKDTPRIARLEAAL